MYLHLFTTLQMGVGNWRESGNLNTQGGSLVIHEEKNTEKDANRTLDRNCKNTTLKFK